MPAPAGVDHGTAPTRCFRKHSESLRGQHFWGARIEDENHNGLISGDAAMYAIDCLGDDLSGDEVLLCPVLLFNREFARQGMAWDLGISA